MKSYLLASLVSLASVIGCPSEDKPVDAPIVDYKTGQGIPVRQDGDGRLYDRFGLPTPYQNGGIPNVPRVPIKEGPEC